ncbi:MAG: hypothetical protein KDC07_12390, partial [Chitinophagaceae bacterium]|nr:hypothetical protein [Chitinophagaceae bacterium]
MNIPGLIFLLTTQFVAGRGILALFNIKQKTLHTIVLAMLNGIMVISLVPMLIELAHIPITKTNIILSISLISIALFAIPFKRYNFSILQLKNKEYKLPSLYEVLFILFLVFIMIPSIWRTYYFPPNARDVLSGPEALAKYAIEEHTLNNSVFSMNLLEATPNLLKPPFISDLQIVYKLLVHPFGQVWLTIIVLCFLTWLYSLLREKLHPVLAGLITLLFISIPELYGYTYILLWDYSNMVFFFAGFYFLNQYFEHKQNSCFLYSCLMFGFATFIRVETLIFAGLITPYIFFRLWQEKVSIQRVIINLVLFLAVPFIFYFIWIDIFVKYYLPPGLNLGAELNFSPATSFFGWLSKINSRLIFGGINIALYGYFIYFFLLILLIDAIFFRSFNKEARLLLFGILVIYLGLPMLIYVTKWFNITTAKRGLFKAFPLIALYMGNSALFLKLSRA